jgi:Holliday junction resolvase RusA-like endonuclease
MISIFVKGEVKAQPRPKARRMVQRIAIYTPPTAKGWKEAVMRAARPYKGRFEKGEALQVDMCFYLVRPKSHYKNNGELRKSICLYHVQKPDFDNLAKAVCDAIDDAGVWHDDSQIITSKISKYWVRSEGGCQIEISKIG